MTTGTFNAKIKHTGTYVKIEQEKDGKEEKFLWLMLNAEIPKDAKPEDFEDRAIMRIVAPKGTAVKDLIEKCEMMLLQSGVRMTMMAMSEKMDEQKATEEAKVKIIPQEVGIIKE